ncbi:MAG: molybdenum cofactor guanylyltransferase MobA [Rhizobiaceae bacterium]|nr:molybdenum cofactor guanylyltransferase MobA [Rhizobiaceae bacterium]
MNIAGVILAGGLSRRMGGNEKSLLQLAGKHPVAWVADAMHPQTSHLALNANGDPTRFEFLDLPVLADTVEGFVGPLAGILAGMRWAATLNGVTHLVSAAADTPFLPNNLVQELQNAVRQSGDIAMADSMGRIHPVFGLWPIHLADDLEHFLVAEDKRKILEFANRYSLHSVNFDKPNSDPFFNINTPEDLEAAEDMAKELRVE